MSRFRMVFRNGLFFLKNSVLNRQFSSYGYEILNVYVPLAILQESEGILNLEKK